MNKKKQTNARTFTIQVTIKGRHYRRIKKTLTGDLSQQAEGLLKMTIRRPPDACWSIRDLREESRRESKRLEQCLKELVEKGYLELVKMTRKIEVTPTHLLSSPTVDRRESDLIRLRNLLHTEKRDPAIRDVSMTGMPPPFNVHDWAYYDDWMTTSDSNQNLTQHSRIHQYEYLRR